MTRRARPSVRSALARRALAGSAAAALLLVTSGCGGGDDTAADPGAAGSTSADAEPSASAPPEEPTSEAAAEEVRAGASVDPGEFVDLLKASLDKASTASISITTAGGVGSLTGEGDADFSSTPPTMTMTMSLPQLGGDVEMRLLDGVAYMKLPQTGDKFISFDLTDPSNPLGSAFTDQLDIATQFDAFGDAIDEVTYVGTDDVDGEELEHYSLAVDGQAVADQSGADAGAIGLPEVITYDVYFDAEGFFRRMAFDLGEQAGSTTLDYSDWGKDVSITAPRPGEITTMPGLPGSG